MFDNTFNDYRIYIRPGSTDMRKRGSSLAFLVQAEMELDPFGKSIFIFCGKTHKILKILVWESNGFWELTKRLEEGTFCYPQDEREAIEVTRDAVLGMLKGENPWRRLPELHPELVC